MSCPARLSGHPGNTKSNLDNEKLNDFCLDTFDGYILVSIPSIPAMIFLSTKCHKYLINLFFQSKIFFFYDRPD